MPRRHHTGILVNRSVYDVVVENTVHDILGDGGDAEVGNLELETGANFLLVTGGFILLE